MSCVRSGMPRCARAWHRGCARSLWLWRHDAALFAPVADCLRLAGMRATTPRRRAVAGPRPLRWRAWQIPRRAPCCVSRHTARSRRPRCTRRDGARQLPIRGDPGPRRRTARCRRARTLRPHPPRPASTPRSSALPCSTPTVPRASAPRAGCRPISTSAAGFRDRRWPAARRPSGRRQGSVMGAPSQPVRRRPASADNEAEPVMRHLALPRSRPGSRLRKNAVCTWP